MVAAEHVPPREDANAERRPAWSDDGARASESKSAREKVVPAIRADGLLSQPG